MIDGSVPHHLEILGKVLARRPGRIEGMGEAKTFNGRLRYPLDAFGRLDTECLQYRRHHIDRVGVLCTHLAFSLDALGPVDDERVADAAAIGLALPAPERRVARPGPAPGVVVAHFRTTELVQSGQVLFQRALYVVEEQRFVNHAGRTAFGAGAVVGEHHNEGVVQFAEVPEELQQAPDVVIGVCEKSGEDFHHTGIELLLLRRAILPRLDIRVMAGQFRILRDNAEFLLLLEDLLSIGFPAVVKLAFVLVGPFLRHVMRRVHGPGAEVHEERLVGRHLLGVGDEADGLVDEILRQMVSFLGRLFGLDTMIVIDQLRVILVRLAAQEAVVALEAATQRPAIIRTRRRDLVGRCQVPLADRIRVVAVLQQHLREKTVLERNVAVAAGIAG